MTSPTKRRTLWLTDEAWAALAHIAKTEGTNPSRIVATYAIHFGAEASVRFNSRPFTPVPKGGKK